MHRSLVRSQLIVDRTANLAARLQFQPNAGLLFPDAPAQLLSDVAENERPQQLVILDGTWHHAKALMRDVPALRGLPRFRLAPATPSRYRIRREPSDAFLSTVEATVAALRVLEPNTEGLEQLVRAFDKMVETQLVHPGSAQGARFLQRRPPSLSHVPQVLLGSLDHVIVAYGEATAGERGTPRTNEPPISWIAQRLGDGTIFSHTLIPPRPLDDTFLKHVELDRTDFCHAISLEEARLRWAKFQRPNDIVAVFQPGTARLFAFLAGDPAPCLILKSVAWKALAERLSADRPPPEPMAVTARNHGRGGKRLAETIALVRQLNALGRQG